MRRQTSNFQYIQFFMKPSIDEPIVHYMTEHQENDGRKLALSYSKFKEFIFENFIINDVDGLVKYLNSHHLVFLNGDTGDYEVSSIYKNAFQASFEELLELNKPKKDELYNNIKSKVIKSRSEVPSVFANKYTKSRRL